MASSFTKRYFPRLAKSSFYRLLQTYWQGIKYAIMYKSSRARSSQLARDFFPQNQNRVI
jgi:hypothetical protein